MKPFSSGSVLPFFAAGILGFAASVGAQDPSPGIDPGELPPPPGTGEIDCGARSYSTRFDECRTRSSSEDEGPAEAVDRALNAVEEGMYYEMTCDWCPPGGDPSQVFCEESIVETTANITTTPPSFNPATHRWVVTACYDGWYKVECAEDCDD